MPIAAVAYLLSKLRSRFDLETQEGQNATLGLTIVPVTQIDPLALTTFRLTTTEVPGAVAYSNIATVPVGEFWHLKSISTEDAVSSDYVYHVSVQVRASTGNLGPIGIGPELTAAGVKYQIPLSLVGITLRPGEQIGLEVTTWVAGGSGTICELLLDLEDCNP